MVCVVPGRRRRGRPRGRLLAREVRRRDRAVGLHDLVVVDVPHMRSSPGALKVMLLLASSAMSYGLPGQRRVAAVVAGVRVVVVEPRPRAGRARRRVGVVGEQRPGTRQPDQHLARRRVDVEGAERAERRVRDRPVGRQLREARAAECPVAVKPYRSSDAVPPTTSSPGSPLTSPTDGPVRNSRSLTGLGQPGWNWPVARLVGGDEVLAALVLVHGQVERPDHAGGRAPGTPPSRPGSGCRRRDARRPGSSGVSYLPVPAAKSVCEGVVLLACPGGRATGRSRRCRRG